VAGDVRALTWERRRQLLDAMAVALTSPAVASADHGDVLGFVEAKELRQGELEPTRDTAGHREGR
jgi:hypothetical protein